LFNRSAMYSNMSSPLRRHYLGVDNTRAQVIPEQHTLLSVFKLNSSKSCKFKHSSTRRRERELTKMICVRTEKICVCTHMKRTHGKPHLRQHANIEFSFKSCAWTDKFTQRLCQHVCLDEYPRKHSLK